MVKLLRKFLPWKEIGWTELGEVFYRYTLIKSRWFNLYLHELTAPEWHPHCHDHPWWFWTLILWNGYLEESDKHFDRRRAGSLLYRPAAFKHNIITPYGKSWSLVMTGPKQREWGFTDCN
jgi:hypothetical protein